MDPETETPLRKKSQYAEVNSFLVNQWIGQIVVAVVGQCLMVAASWGCRCIFKWEEPQLREIRMLQEQLKEVLGQHSERQASQNRQIEEERKLQTRDLNAASAGHESVGNHFHKRTSRSVRHLVEVLRRDDRTTAHMDIDCDIGDESTRPAAATALNGASRNSTMAPASKDGHGPGHSAVDIIVVIDRSLSTTERETVRNAMPIASDKATEISGSHVFQTSISFQEGHLVDQLSQLLENLNQGSMNLSESSTIQLGHWGIFDQGEKRLERFMETNLPTLVMCTRIADDNIAVFGSHLKGEESISIYAATAERKFPLDVAWDEDEILPGVERGVASLPSEFVGEGDIYSFGEGSNEGDLWIYATKTVPAGEARTPTIFRSRAVLVPLRNTGKLFCQLQDHAVVKRRKSGL